jgi:hypothetical protein
MIGPETSPFIALDGPFCGAAHPLGGRPLVLGTGRPFGKRVETNQRSCGAARRTDDQAPAIALAECADQGSPALTSQPWDGGSSNIQVYRPSETLHLTRELLGVLVEEPVAEAGVEQDERKRPLALVGEGEEAP